jgi:hypothetical protein
MARVVILELDVAQESRVLSPVETALRSDLKVMTLGLASLARTIVRQKSRCRFLSEGDANTRFFHLQACHRRRKNYLHSFQHEGALFSTDEAKSGAVFDYFNRVFGNHFQRSHSIDLERLDLPRLDLSTLAAEFSDGEIMHAVLETPVDRAPGPDGFTGRFYRAAWTVIKADVCAIFRALWAQDWRSFYLVNAANMVLLPKKDVPQGLKDYRPISLMHSFSKLFSKALALRLSPFMDRLVHANQTAFIRGRRIHDNFRSVQLYCRWLHAGRRPCTLLKIDIAKAFDSVSWTFLLQVLERLGVPLACRDWVSAMLSSASTKVLVNGRLSRRICHARGLRQGDPLSPLLFVLVMEVLSSLIREADRRGLLTPLPGDQFKHRLAVYADDVVLFLAPSPSDFTCVKSILELFAGASGLLTNVDKCMLSPIRCSEEQVAAVRAVFPCQLSPFPCRYLGAPLSLRRLSRADEQQFVDAVARRIPTWKAGLITAAGRLTLAQSTLSAIPVHVSITCVLSPWAIGQIDKRRRAFIWAGAESVAAGKCKVAWTSVCSPRAFGGLGIPNLRTLGFALRLRWEWQRRQPDAPAWARLPSKESKVVLAMFDASVSVVLGDGTSAKFWTDRWLPEGRVQSFAPNLFRAIGRRFLSVSVREALAARTWVRHITGAPTVHVLVEYVLLWERLESVALRPDVRDRLVWRWSADGAYSSSSAYKAFFHGLSSLPGARQLWRAAVPPKVKFFAWLALRGRIWTAARRRRHGLQADDSCALCDQEAETADHLLLSCVFAREVWDRLLRRAHIWLDTPTGVSPFVDWCLSSRKRLPRELRRGFDSLALLVAWSLWKERNRRVFDAAASSVDDVVKGVIAEGGLWVAAGFKPLQAFVAPATSE